MATLRKELSDMLDEGIAACGGLPREEIEPTRRFRQALKRRVMALISESDLKTLDVLRYKEQQK